MTGVRDVSVIVPVFNPGEYLQPLLDCLDRQSIGADRFEAIFVDDGSTDGTGERLDTWAATRPHVTVVHQENHGWPGQPRNVAIDRAVGDYVQFVDQDDWLADDALERLVDFAREHASDVIISKMVGIDRGVPSLLFRRSAPRVTFGDEPVQDSMTPHKMFRRAFLDEIGLRFPEGRRRLEDHLFVTTAYLRADVISVYAESDCYFHIGRPDRGNAGFRAYDPEGYYANLEEVIDVVEALAPSPQVRDVFLGRWLRVELIGRMRSNGVYGLPPAERATHYRPVRRIVRERVPLATLQSTPVLARWGAAVVRHADDAAFFALEAARRKVTAHAWRDGDLLRVRIDTGTGRTAHDLGDFLREHAPALADVVLEETGANPALLPGRVTDGDGHTASAGPDGGYLVTGGFAAGATLRVSTPLGMLNTVVSRSRASTWTTSPVVRKARRFLGRAWRRTRRVLSRVLPSRRA